MSDKPLKDRMTCRASCINAGRWSSVVRRPLREAMVDGAMNALETEEATYATSDEAILVPSFDASHWRSVAARGARSRAQSCGSALLFISIALKLFEWFILPKILRWWEERRGPDR